MQNAPLRGRKSKKKFWGGLCPLPRPIPVGEGMLDKFRKSNLAVKKSFYGVYSLITKFRWDLSNGTYLVHGSNFGRMLFLTLPVTHTDVSRNRI